MSDYGSRMADEQRVPVTLSSREWAIVQDALDTYAYEVEHSNPGGIRRSTKDRRAAQQSDLLSNLKHLAVEIDRQAGVGPRFF